ncbi:MAG: integral membrane [Lasallia pustulata]|uniref:Integral membrane n=1 Tax=Lasallia pustulata TaxID=136370 RepID=A0A5M8PKN0_9LECA|nr:MAG: integral membrane [Lasallia pustulata]
MAFYTTGLIIIELVLIVLASLAVVARIWARKIKKSIIHLNDYLCIAALILSAAFVTGSLTATFFGGQGQHIQHLTSKQVTIVLKCFVGLEIMWSTANTAAKLSILHLYIQIFCNRTFRHIALGVMALTCCYCATVFLETFLVCRPVAYNWDKTIVGGKCGNQPTIYFSAGLMNLLLDIVILVLPMPMLWGLKMPLFKKIALTAVFGMGAGIISITVLRIIYVKNLNFDDDITYSVALVSLLSALEPTLGVINACLPVIQPVLHRIYSSLSACGISLRSRAKSQKGILWSGSKARGSTDDNVPISISRKSNVSGSGSILSVEMGAWEESLATSNLRFP